MAENDLKQKNFNIEIVKQLLLRDINDISVNNDMDKSTFCEVEESFPPVSLLSLYYKFKFNFYYITKCIT